MKIIISPAKRMKEDNDYIQPLSTPKFIDKTEKLKGYLQKLDFEQLKKLLCCNDKIAQKSFEEYKNMDLLKNTTPAILAFDGIQYKYMAPGVFENRWYDYVQKNLFIMSGFYGVLKPFDGVVPYRLEMLARLKTDFCKSLYDFWGDSLFKEITHNDDTIVNLSSKEYLKAIKPYFSEKTKCINCLFGEIKNGKPVEKGVYVKMARGEMVRYMAENNVEDIEEIKRFSALGFSFCESLSDYNNYTFLFNGKTRKNNL